MFQHCRWVSLIMAVALIGGSYGWLQGIAWVGMTVRGLQEYQSITQALDKTFDGSAPCSLCTAISKNQSESEHSGDLLALQKQKEIPVSIPRILICPNRPELATLPEKTLASLPVSFLPETPPPRSI